MRLINKTNLNTMKLKSFVRQIALFEKMTSQDIKKLVINAIHRRKGKNWKDEYVTGYAYYGKPVMCLKFVKDVMPDKVQMAKTVAHELAHTQGVYHGKAMNNSQYGWKKGWQEYWAWANELPLEMRNTHESSG